MTSSPEKEQKLAKGSEKEESHFLVPSPIPTRRTRTTSQLVMCFLNRCKLMSDVKIIDQLVLIYLIDQHHY